MRSGSARPPLVGAYGETPHLSHHAFVFGLYNERMI
jgi:hypothetical protein